MSRRAYLDDVYRLSDLGVRDVDGAIVAEGTTWEKVECAAHPEHFHSGRRIGPLHIEVRRDRSNDFVWTYAGDLLIRERVREALSDGRATGYELNPVIARTLNGRPVSFDLREVTVTGYAGFAPPESGVRLLYSCPACGHAIYSAPTDVSRLIVRSEWDGSDIFLVWPLPRFIFVTHRIVRLITSRGFQRPH